MFHFSEKKRERFILDMQPNAYKSFKTKFQRIKNFEISQNFKFVSGITSACFSFLVTK